MTDSSRPMIPFSGFEWDEQKRLRNIETHGIDFKDATKIFESPFLNARSDRGKEIRYVALGRLDDVEIAVVYTVRNSVCRIISARRARQNERKAYHKAFGGKSEKGQN